MTRELKQRDAERSNPTQRPASVAMGVPPEKRVVPGFDGWPDRCASPLHAFAEAIKEGGGSADLAAASEKLATTVATGTGVTSDLGPLVDKLFARAAAEKLVLARATDVPEPARAEPMTLSTLAPEARMFGESITLTSVHRSPSGDETLRFVVDDKAFSKGPAVCELAEGSRTPSRAPRSRPPPPR